MEKHIYKSMNEASLTHWWFRARENYLKQILSKFVKNKNNKILEIGIGTGANIKILQKYGEVFGIDVSEQSINLVKEKFPNVKVYKKKFPSQSLDEKYHLICLFDVLEHIDNDEEALKKINDLLIENGNLIISVPAFNFLWSYHDEIHHHKRRYSKNDLKGLLISSGYKIEFCGYFNFLLFPLALIQRVLSKFTSLKNYDPYKKNFLNEIFFNIFNLESKMITEKFPFGLSLIYVLRKEEN